MMKMMVRTMIDDDDDDEHLVESSIKWRGGDASTREFGEQSRENQ